MANLALTFWNQGRWKEAEELEFQVMETSLRVLGQEHPDTLTSIANLALTYRDQERRKEAEALEVQVMEIRKRILGQEHPDTLTSTANLASTYQNQGRWEEAEELEVQGMDEKEGILPRESRFVIPHGQPRIDIPEPGAMEGGRRTGSAGHGDEKEVL